MDQYEDGNILLSDLHSLKTTSGRRLDSIAGKALAHGYSEGKGQAARFKDITGFTQINSTAVIVVDSGNHCLRLVNRVTGDTKMYLGRCTQYGYSNGRNALLDQPRAIISDCKDRKTLLVTDSNNQAVRHIDIEKRIASTFLKDSRLNRLYGITQEVLSGDIFLTTSAAIYQIQYKDKLLSLIAGSPTQMGYKDGLFSDVRISDPCELILIDSGLKLVVADKNNNRLRVLDRRSNTSYSYCGLSSRHTDLAAKPCSLDSPVSMMVSGGSLYVGENQMMRILSGINLTNTSLSMFIIRMNSKTLLS